MQVRKRENLPWFLKPIGGGQHPLTEKEFESQRTTRSRGKLVDQESWKEGGVFVEGGRNHRFRGGGRKDGTFRNLQCREKGGHILRGGAARKQWAKKEKGDSISGGKKRENDHDYKCAAGLSIIQGRGHLRMR